MTLDTYIGYFSHLRRAPGAAWSENTRRRAPHKPLLLLAVMDLVARNVIRSSFLSIADELFELNDLFTDYWRSVVPITQTSSIAFPFSRLHNEPFWNLVAKPGQEITAPVINSITSVNQLRNVALGAQMDEELFSHMSDLQGRNALAGALLASCFSDDGRAVLRGQLEVHAQAFEYSQVLEAVAHQQLAKEDRMETRYQAAARDQGFRRAIVFSYDHRCAFCGTRIVTSEGHTVVDAAHIVPWSVSRNDDIRNGMALCKLCHWSFDEGLMSVSDTYSVLVSKQLTGQYNAAGVLLTLSKREILRPQDQSFWPHQQHLNWHRREKFKQ